MADAPTPKTPRGRQRLRASRADLHRRLYQPRPMGRKLVLLQKIVLGLVIAGLVAFIGYITWFIARPLPTRVRIVITGTRGLNLAGEMRVDGRDRALNASVPTNYSFAARDLSFTVKRSSGQGDLNVNVFLNGKQRSATTSGTAAGGVWIEMRNGVFEKRYETGTFEFKR